MEYDAVKIWVDVAQFVITGAIGVYMYLTNKGDATNRRISDLEGKHDKRLDGHGDRLAKIEEAIKHMPTHDDLSGLRTDGGKMAADIASLKAETHGQTELLRRLEATVGRISDWLIDRAK